MKESFERNPAILERYSRRTFLKQAVLATLIAGVSWENPVNSDAQTLSKIVGEDGLDLWGWEFNNVPPKLEQLFWGRAESDQSEEIVKRYFFSKPHLKTLETDAELVLGKQIKQAFDRKGIFSRIPIAIKFIDQPKSVVISSRKKIEILGQMPLRFGLTKENAEALEEKVESFLGVSALVFDAAGWATWPAGIIRGMDLQSSIKTASHEATHQILAPTPLGRIYTASFFGFPRNNEVAAMNETLADMMGDEISKDVITQHYPQDQGFQPETNTEVLEKTTYFDKILRTTRVLVDQYLAVGQIERAESLMQERRDRLNTLGLQIRRLNQAFFAINGIYAARPSVVNPIGEVMKELRQRHSVAAFFRLVSNVTSFSKLEKILKLS